MLSLLKQSLKRALRLAGIEARRFSPSASPTAQLLTALRDHGINLVFDVGANVGQFAKELRAGGYTGRIVSIDPLTSAHSKLQVESRFDPSWHIHTRCAIGDHIGEIALNISGNSVSSSVLPMLS